MKKSSFTLFGAGRGAALVAFACLVALGAARAADTVDVGERVPDAAVVKEGLFPEDACKELEAAGYKCMGFKPAVRFMLPAASFRVGSADLPELLRQQLDVFADVLRGRKGSAAGRVIRVEGHADASGTPEVNQSLSQKRADAVKAYLVGHGADESMLEAVGLGSSAPKVAGDPFAAANRRVEIGRAGGS